ncbi:GIDE domain-containing protein [Porticoccus sp.]
MPAPEFAVWLTIACAVSLFSLKKGHRQFKRARLIEDMPTSKIRSASQGYTELVGVAELQGHPQLAPLSNTLCLWWRYTIEKYQSSGKSSHWVTVEKRVCGQPFYLRDSTGICQIDATGADISCKHRHVWYGSTPKPIGTPKPGALTSGFFSLNSGFGRRYRYSEYLILEGDPLYTLGEFITDSTGQRALSPQQLRGDILRAWKADFSSLLEKFDHNGDGELDLREWQIVQDAALQEAHRQQRELVQQPAQHLLTKPRHQGLPFIIGSDEQQQLSSRFRRGAVLYSGGFLLAGSLASWLLGSRLFG